MSNARTARIAALTRWCSAALSLGFLVSSLLPAGESSPLPPDLAVYFGAETDRLAEACLTDIRSQAEWENRRTEYRRQLFDMLGLWPMPPRSNLQPVITGRMDSADGPVERLHFQSMPGLYVTANFYLPRDTSQPVPTILVACGHAQVKTNGISYGNKAGYQHFGSWFARHGYACLIIDTLQLGEIEGLHHGTHHLGQWWWNARGYSPAGVEAWNSIRALDYLESRPEVDARRIGMTGRSGGGSYTWTTAALDDRVRVAAPTAGITDLRNQVVDGCVGGHCDCMFFVNTYRWDFPLNAALLAPRPLLIVNSDADTIFPLDGVIRLHQKVRRVYGLYQREADLGLVIGPGPHQDTQDLQVPVLRWFDRHLKHAQTPIEDAALKRFTPAQLRVFDALPADARNAQIQESFGPAAGARRGTNLLESLRAHCFRGWPQDGSRAVPQFTQSRLAGGLQLSTCEWETQPGARVRLWIASPVGRMALNTELHVLGTNEMEAWASGMGKLFENRLPLPPGILAPLSLQLKQTRSRRVWMATRGVGELGWKVNEKTMTEIRRRYMLLGQTLEGMRVWDIRQAIEALPAMLGKRVGRLTVTGHGTMGVNALYASLFEPSVRQLTLSGLPESHRQGPDYLNVLSVTDIRETLAWSRERGAAITVRE